MLRFRAVFLDVGGTLLKMGDPPTVYREVLARHGYELPLEAVREALVRARELSRDMPSGPLPDHTIVAEREERRREFMVRELLSRLGVRDRFEECQRAVRDSWLGKEMFPQYPEAEAVLSALKRGGYIVGAVSNWESRLEQLIANHGLRRYFDFVLASEREGHVKPGTALFEKALRLAGVAASEAVHVGDSYEHDVWSARSLGITAVLVLREGARPVDHSPTIRSLEQLLPLVESGLWVQGRVFSGMGEAARFTSLPWVIAQVQDRLGFVPYPGTLNIRVSTLSDRTAAEQVRALAGVELVSEPGFCPARCFPAVVDGAGPAAVVVPGVPGYPEDVVEVLAPVCLREVLGLQDGSLVTVAIAVR